MNQQLMGGNWKSQMKSELEQERLQSAKLCRENETLRALNIECSRLASERSAKLTEMESVLEWANDNVEWCSKIDAEWRVSPMCSYRKFAPTLYDALYSAWKERGDK